ncbi:hypothetical protein ACTFIV_003820 [Dictyostelium citrinum]
MENNQQDINTTSSPIKTEISNHENKLSEKVKETEKEHIEPHDSSQAVDLNKSGEENNINNQNIINNNENKQQVEEINDHEQNEEIEEEEFNSDNNDNSIEKGNTSQNSNNNIYYHSDQCGYCLICKCYDYGEITHNIVEDSEILKQSIGFSFVDDTSINSILAHRNYAEKQAIMKKFNDKYNKSLEIELRDHTHQKYRRTLVSLLTEPSMYDTLNVEYSIRTKNSNALIEIFLTRTNEQKELVKRIYLVKYGKNIEHDIIAKFSQGKSVNGNMMKQLLLAMLKNDRDSNNNTIGNNDDNDNSTNNNHSNKVDMKLIAEDSNRLYQAGEHKKGTDHEVFIEILTKRSLAHLRELDTFYQNANPKSHSLRRAIELEFTSKSIKQVKTSLLDILLFSREPTKYWAEQFNHALTSGWGINEIDLTRLTITQQHQASQIKQAYISHYDNSLITAISSKTSFRYKKIILSMLTV